MLLTITLVFLSGPPQVMDIGEIKPEFCASVGNILSYSILEEANAMGVSYTCTPQEKA